EAIALSKDSLGGHKLLGRILATEGLNSGNKEKIQEAIVEFLEVTRIDNKDPDSLKALAGMYNLTNDPDRALSSYQSLISLGFATFADYFEVARIQYSKGKYRESAQAARQAFEQSGNNPQAGMLLADSLLQLGQTKEAIEILKLSLAETPNNLELNLDLGDALTRAGRYDEAIQQINKVLEVRPKNLRALNLLAQVQRRSGKRKEAIETFKKALEGQDVTDSLELQFELAETYEEIGDLDSSIKAYEDALSALLDPDGTAPESTKRNAGVVLRAIALAYRNSGKLDKTLETFERMRKVLGSDSTLPDVLLIDTLRNEGKYKEALEAVYSAKSRFPKERQFKFLEAQSLSQLQRPDEASEVLKGLINGSQEDADVHHFAAFIMMDNNRLDDAERNLRKALLFDEKNVSYLITLSSIQDRAKNYKESETTLRKVLELDPDNATALNNLGYFLTERNERLEEALELIQRAINIEPGNGSFLDSLGWVYFKLGKFEEAKKNLEQALIYDKRSAAVHEHLGDLYYKIGQVDEARKKWKQALELTHDKEEMVRLEEKLKDPKNALADKTK
ncbi:MAG: tetratricopeptide repeat protein, partial [Blastocatellia bacterium]|nr:tetratricopeptide repeat protein [Blastocatellia bacterium]